MKKRWTFVAALFVLVAVLFAWEKGFPPFEPRQPNVAEQTAPVQAEPAQTGADKTESGTVAPGQPVAEHKPVADADKAPDQALKDPHGTASPQDEKPESGDAAAQSAPLVKQAEQAAGHTQLLAPSLTPPQDPSHAGAQPEDKPATQPTDNPAAADAANPDEEGAAPGEEVVRGTVEKGDTVTKILAGADSQTMQDYISAAKRVFSMRAFRDGQPYVVVTDTATGKVKRFEYEIDSRRRLVVEGMDQPVARVEAIEYVTLLSSMTSVINDNLFQAVADAGESPQMALKLAELFGSEINFIRDLQEGDSFSVLVEKRYREGEYKGYGRILAAHFTNKGKTFEAYLFREGSKGASYYNSKGENVRKSLLQAPLAFTRVTSRFTKNRLHPILGYSRPHEGVDYAAPTGTPVKAVGEGVVTARQWAGGYGNQIIIRHGGGLESLYAHLSGYARGLKNGEKVRQGQVIGFVGMTGLATGPHLDFRLRQSGKFVNPAKAINPRGEPVSKGAMKAFEKVMAVELAALKGEKTFPEYTVDSIVADQVEPARPEKSPEPEQKPEKRKKKHRN